MNLEESLRSIQGAQSSMYLYGVLSLGLNLIFPLILLSVCLYFLNHILISESLDFRGFLEKNFSALVIETLRSWGKILSWSFLFILPGIWKYFQYLLVPFVVMADPDYASGQVDALERSSVIVKKHWKALVLFLFLFNLFIPLVTTGLFNSYRLIWKNPTESLVLSALDSYVLILSTHILYNIFRKEVAPYDDAHV